MTNLSKMTPTISTISRCRRTWWPTMVGEPALRTKGVLVGSSSSSRDSLAHQLKKRLQHGVGGGDCARRGFPLHSQVDEVALDEPVACPPLERGHVRAVALRFEPAGIIFDEVLYLYVVAGAASLAS